MAASFIFDALAEIGTSLRRRLRGKPTRMTLLVLPGMSPQGPLLRENAAGWLAATAVGAAAGAATGGIVGALTEAGVSAEDAHSYAEGVRRGGTLVSARVTDRSRLD